ncbi:DUF6807 domain-containing protein [Arenibacter amylolyticus]|uniref:DUF6807 domain-containing protein n=1 Tax=Arenibacter amylolyticus TaxID=1406873 RepID=UPI000A3A3FE2|nr:PmoA family protein [Arenibacter amylolyticus]
MKERKQQLSRLPLAIGATLLILGLFSCKQINRDTAQLHPSEKNKEPRIQLLRDDAQKQVSVLIDGQLFTAYRYPSNIKKPVLYPLVTPEGSTITRKFPLEPSAGERADHPHHVGVWFNYGDVNGLDFWNNSDSIKVERRDEYGTIVHKNFLEIQGGDSTGLLKVAMDWIAPRGEVLLTENTTFLFKGEGDVYSIDRITQLSAPNGPVLFKDNKEGVLGIRVARALEHPSDKPIVFTDANGLPTAVPVLNNDGVNGNYINSEGVEGNDCWGKRADWVNLTSSIGKENISLVILDHKNNPGYPTYWHARGYGLFAANPLGQEVFSKGEETLNFRLEQGEAVTFKHSIIVASKHLGKTELDHRFSQFNNE